MSPAVAVDHLPPQALLGPHAFATRDPGHVQARLGVVYQVFAVVVLGAWAVTVVALLGARGLAAAPLFLSTSRLGHLASGLVLAAAAWRCRGRAVPMNVLAVLDGGAAILVSTLAATSIAHAPPGVHAELMPVIAFGLLVTTRAALVPTSPRHTLIVALLSAVPVPIGIWTAVDRDPTWNAALVPPGTFLVVALTWIAGAVLAAWSIARAVHGLRAEVRKASRVGPYTLEEKIGEGGMGVVYRARHALLRRPTAIKVLSPDRTDKASEWRFEREAQITSSLTHPNTVAVYDFGRTPEGQFYYAMELLRGTTLERLVEREGPQPARRVAHILAQMAGALAEAHDAGLVHRDVKPANVFLCERGGAPDFVKVLDFGLVKDLGGPSDPSLSHEGTIKGTPHYLAPESILAPTDVGTSSDLYGLGAVGYFLLTGRPPFDGINLVDVCRKHIYVTPEAPSDVLGHAVDPALERLVLRCLAKTPHARPASAAAVVRELSSVRA